MQGCARRLAALAALLLAAGPAVAAGDRISGLPNPEDLAPLEGGRWVIASSMAGGSNPQGALSAIDTATGAIRTLYPSDAAAGAASAPGCANQVAATAFAPHGIALQTGRLGVQNLYVVNHGGRESIEVFEVRTAPEPALRWVGCTPLPAGARGNAVAALPDGTLFVSNMGASLDGSRPPSMMGGDVITWTAATGWKTVPGSAIAAPNGLLASPDGKRLYVASWTGGEVVEIPLQGDRADRRVIRVGLLPDNLRWTAAGAIRATGHRTSIETVIGCFTGQAACAVPSAVAEIDPAAFRVVCARPVELDIATVAVDVGDEIWIGAARGASVLRLPGSALSSPACE